MDSRREKNKMEMRAKIDKKLAKEILKRVDIDQAMRERFRAHKKTWNYSVDKKNTVWLKKIVERYGWPTVSFVGKKASHGAWLLVQHADHDIRFQKKVLGLLEKIYEKDKTEIRPSDIAYLTDRVLTHQNKLQIFGTQFKRKDPTSMFRPFPIKDAKNVDKRRKGYGLSTLEEYATIINKRYKTKT